MLKNIVNHGIYGKVPLYDVREVSTFREMFESSVALYENNVAFLQKYGIKQHHITIFPKSFLGH